VSFEYILFWVAVLIFASVISSKLSDKFAIPVLLLFLGIGMLAGSEGIGRVPFDDASLAKSIGIVALIFIIFSGGLETNWKDVKPVVGPGILLSTLGVLLTAVIIGFFAVFVLKFPLLEGMLLGSIVSSTDAPAVFSILRSRRMGLKKPLNPLLEFESGSNDPMAVFLTVGFIGLLTARDTNIWSLLPRFIWDMGIGAAIGYVMAQGIILFMNRIKLEYEGLYPVMMISFALLTYVTAVFLRANGILSVFLAGLILGQAEFPHKKMVLRFHGGLAWLMQIIMFVTLGLLVFPSHIIPLIGPGILLTFLLMFVARPISVFLCLVPSKLSLQKKAMIAWVGLRGAVPIILATFPFMAGIPQADTIFNVVFFVVIASVFIQGTTIPWLSRLLKLDVPWRSRTSYPIEFEKTSDMDADLTETIVPYGSQVVGQRIRDLGVPDKCLIVLVSRDEKFVIPSGSTVIESGDVLLVLANAEDFSEFQRTLSQLKAVSQDP
jgi:cell volume regulation protein A